MMRVLGLVLSLVGAPAPGEADAAREAEVRTALNARGSAFDACTERYLREYPKAKGTATVEFRLGPKGRVVRAQADTKLVGARNLRPCLEAAAKTVQFPTSGGGPPGRLKVTIPVEKGARFRLPAPGESPGPAPKKTIRTVIRFLPGS